MENVLDVLKIIAAVVNILFGGYSLVRTEDITSASHLALKDVRGKAEVRIGFGGFFLAFGLAALLLNDPAAYRLLGFGYFGAVITRLASLAVDDPDDVLDRSYILLAIAEVMLGAVLVA